MDEQGDNSAEPVTNPFITEVFRAAAEKEAELFRTQAALRGASAKAIAVGGVPGKPLKKVLHFVGLLRELPNDASVWRVYTTPALDEGVDVLKAEVLYRGQLPASRQDGLVRDVVVVPDEADVIYWSKTPPRTMREPGGGNGFPYGK